MAEADGNLVGGALNLLGADTLYGRNWGCSEDYKFLHFEACYYRAIDFAIKRGLKWVEAGAQGTHKIQRGYLPRTTYSAHWIADPNLKTAVSRFLDEERHQNAHEMDLFAAKSPYRQEDGAQDVR
jgi:predicted N-acyltransferase